MSTYALCGTKEGKGNGCILKRDGEERARASCHPKNDEVGSVHVPSNCRYRIALMHLSGDGSVGGGPGRTNFLVGIITQVFLFSFRYVSRSSDGDRDGTFARGEIFRGGRDD